MEEKVLVVSDNSWVKKNKKRAIILIIFAIINAVISGVLQIIADISETSLWEMKVAKNDPSWRLVSNLYDASFYFILITVALAVFAIIFLIVFFYIRKTELTVTNKRIYGRVAFGKQVDLPVDSISAVSTSALKGISVATSSGRISFLGLTNRDDISKEIANLLIERQNTKPVVSQPATVASNNNSMDDLVKLNDLLKAGIITQEEFDLKKKQLLGL